MVPDSKLMVKNKKDAELIRQLADSMTSYGVVFGKNNFCMVYLCKYCKRPEISSKFGLVVYLCKYCKRPEISSKFGLVVEVAGIQPAC